MTASTFPGTDYRPDIDGMRAIALLAVVGFHAEVSGFQAGFAGVDVFFVISGYLISGIIFRSLERGSFRFSDFYARRISRIFPALLIILCATLVTGWVILFPGEMAALGKHVFGGATFVSNFILWSEAGYFDSSSKPLLHLWSLAVEEQFYILFPAVAVLAWKRRWNMRWTLISLIEMSFVFNMWSVRHGQTTAAFYFPFHRFWEILAGALLCEVELRGIATPKWSLDWRAAGADVTSLLGLSLFAVAALTINRNDFWPGSQALIPVTATVLLIASGRHGVVNRTILAHPLMVAIGLISYPLYLWHWPLLVFAKILNRGEVPSFGWRGVVISVAALLAGATYFFVERPVRFGKRKRRSAALMFPILMSVGLLGIAFNARLLKPRLMKQRYSAEFAEKDWDYPSPGGFAGNTNSIIVHEIPGDTARTVVFLGDSHVQHYWPRIVEKAKTSKQPLGRVLFVTYSGCPLLPKVNPKELAYHGGHYRCPAFYDRAMSVALRRDVKVVVLSGWWEAQIKRGNYEGPAQIQDIFTTSVQGSEGPLELLAKDVARLTARGKRVFLVLSYPDGPAFEPASLLAGRLPFLSTSPVTAVSRQDFERAVEPTVNRFRHIAETTGATIISPVENLCSATQCPTVGPDGLPMYRDQHHFRAGYARKFLTYIDVVLE